MEILVKPDSGSINDQQNEKDLMIYAYETKKPECGGTYY